MSRLEYSWWCSVLAAVLGVSWGGLIYWFHEGAGLLIGSVLFVLCFVILFNTYEIEQGDLPQPNRRFNDL